MNRSNSAHFLLRLILICLAGLTVLVLATGYVLTRQKAATNRLNKAIDLHYRSYRLADQLRQSSDDLTRMVRTYAVTGDSRFEEHFHTILNIRDGKVPRPEQYDRIFWDFKVAGEAIPGSQGGKRVSLYALMEDAGFADEEFELLAESQRRSDRLVELEQVAINAIKGRFRDEEGTFTTIGPPDRELALQILFGKEYHQAKSDIMKPINEFLVASDKRTTNTLADAHEERRSLSLALVCLLCCLLTVSPLVALAGYRYHRVTHAELRNSEGRFRATFEQAAVGIAHVSPDGNFLRINDRFCEIVGYTKDEMLALTFRDITHPDDLTADVGEVQRLLRGEADAYSMEKRYVHKDGETVWVNLTVSLLRDNAGEPRWFVSVVEDISEKKQAATELVRSESKFRRLYDSNVIGIIFWNTAGDITDANDEFLHMVGYTREEILSGKVRWKDMTPPEYASGDEKALEELAATGVALNLEKEFYRKDGTRVPILLGAALLEGSSDTGICYILDLSERKQAEADVRESEARFRSLMEQSPLAIEILTPEGQISEVNAAWMRLWDFNEEEARQSLEKYNMLADRQIVDLGVEPLVRKAFAGEPVVLPPIEYVVNRTTKDIGLEHIRGRSPWIQCHLYAIKNPDGKITHVVNTYMDITARKEMESNLEKSEAHLLRAQEVANAGSWDLDIPSGKLFWSAEVYRILGVTQGEPVSYEAFLETVVPEDREHVEQSWQAALRGEPYDIEHRIVVDGQTKWLREKAQIDFDKDGQAIRGVGIVQDITARKKAESQIHAYQERLRALASELTMTEERERRRIATELHDGAAQSLAFARMQLASACKAVAEAEAAKKLEGVSQILRQSLQQIREVLLDLSSPSMNEIGLGAAISEWLAQQIGRHHGLRTAFADECGKVPLDDDVRAVLFRNTRELLANVVKHAEADIVSVRMEATGGALRITIEDDGAGFDPDKKLPITASRGFGLFSIRECMLDLGGALEMVSAPGKGCAATLVMPLDSDEQRS